MILEIVETYAILNLETKKNMHVDGPFMFLI